MFRRLQFELGRFLGECVFVLVGCAAAIAFAVAMLGSLALGHAIEIVNPGYARRAHNLETEPRLSDRLWSRLY